MIPIKQLIPAFYEANLSTPMTEPYLEIAEFFSDTIQGEGAYMGQPSTFLRLQWCTQNCVWCDTKEVWRFGNPFTFGEIFELMEHHDVIEKLRGGQHLVVTGGSPIRQQNALVLFFYAFDARYKFLPTIQIENECTLMPSLEMRQIVSIWNNSPKLRNSGNADKIRYKPEILTVLSSLNNSWFKFVITCGQDWAEVERDFLSPGYIKREQVILMPQGATREELEINRENVIALAIKNNVRYSTREHIVVWDKKTGI